MLYFPFSERTPAYPVSARWPPRQRRPRLAFSLVSLTGLYRPVSFMRFLCLTALLLVSIARAAVAQSPLRVLVRDARTHTPLPGVTGLG